MRKTKSFVFSFLMTIILANAQSDARLVNIFEEIPQTSVTGKLVDGLTKEPLEFGTITLFSPVDSSIITWGVSDLDGNFKITTKERIFDINIEYVACHAKNIDSIQLDHGQYKLALGTIELAPRIEDLVGIEVNAQKPMIMMSLDKRVINVGKDLTSEGGTAEDILRNVPGIWMDMDGNISLRSSDNVRILLDGQSSLLISDNNSNGLQQIQANAIDRIEIITNPSAKYDASGMSGIINIVLKKDQTKGLNASLNSNIGHPDNYGLGGNINYRKNKINFFANAGAWYINRPGTGQFQNRFYNINNSGTTLFSTMDRTHDLKTMPMHIQVGSDYYLNPKNTLTASFTYRGKMDNNTSQLLYKDALGSPDDIYLITERKEEEKGQAGNMNFHLRHQKSFSKKGHRLTTAFQYEDGQQKVKSDFDEIYFDKNNTRLDTAEYHQLSKSNSGNRQIFFKSDYVLPLGKESKLEVGLQNSFRIIRDNFSVENEIGDVLTIDTNFTNNFKYQEDVWGVYSNLSHKVKRFVFQGGLRLEHTSNQSSLFLLSDETTSIGKYFSLFPNVSAAYKLPNNASIQMSYNRRISRPTYWDLNPFFTMRDRRNIFRGNPNIRPEFTDAIEIGYIKYWDKATFSAIAYYRQTDDVIKRLQRVDDRFPQTTITQTENLDFKKNYGVELTYSFNLSKWWQLSGDMNLYHTFAEGTFLHQGAEIYVGGKSYSLSSKTISRITLWDKISTQTTFSYAAPRNTTQGVSRSMFAMDFASSMDVLNNNGTVTLSVSDLFNSRRRRSFSEDATFYSEDNFLWQSRAVILSFHYRINHQNKSAAVLPLETEGGKF